MEPGSGSNFLKFPDSLRNPESRLISEQNGHCAIPVLERLVQ